MLDFLRKGVSKAGTGRKDSDLDAAKASVADAVVTEGPAEKPAETGDRMGEMQIAEASMAIGENHIDASIIPVINEAEKPAADENDEDGDVKVGLP